MSGPNILVIHSVTENKLEISSGWVANAAIEGTLWKSLVYVFSGNSLLYTDAAMLTGGMPPTLQANRVLKHMRFAGDSAPNILVKDVMREGKFGLFPGVSLGGALTACSVVRGCCR